MKVRLRLARRFCFWSIDEFPMRRRAIRWEISLRSVKGHESGARDELIAGNEPSHGWVFSGIFLEPLPGMDVWRVVMQNRAHDDHWSAPLQWRLENHERRWSGALQVVSQLVV